MRIQRRLLAGAAILATACVLWPQGVHGQRPQGPLVVGTEIEARQALDEYYEWLGVPDCTGYVTISRDAPEDFFATLYRPLCRFIPECRGDPSLMACSGGETVCVLRSLARKCRLRATVADRSRLIEGLAGLPAEEGATENDWVAGQLVNLLLKNGRLDRAQSVADGCEASLWWCQALRGYVHHRRGGHAEGEAALDSALASVPAGLAPWRNAESGTSEPGAGCSWTDISMLLGEDLRGEYDLLPCENRAAFEARFWWLVDPLWSEPGNPRRSEHLSRYVQLRLDDDITPQSPSRRARIVREGWSNSWRAYQPPPDPREDPIRMTPELRERHQWFVLGGYSFVPDDEVIRAPGESTPAGWTVEPEPDGERFVTPETWHDVVGHQTAVVRRDEALVVLQTALLPVIVDDLGGVEASLALGRPADLTVDVADGSVRGGVVRASSRVADGEWLASLELRGGDWRGRRRGAVVPPSLDEGFGVSAPVLVREEPGPGDDSLLATMLPTTDMSGRTSAGLYFEVYGVVGGESLEFSVEIARTNRSFFGRLGSVFGIGSSRSTAVDWTEPADVSSAGVSRRHLEISLDGPGPLSRCTGSTPPPDSPPCAAPTPA